MNNNIKDLYSTKVTDHDLAIANKDRYGVFYSTDGKRLLGIEHKDFYTYEYVIKEGTEVICDHAFKKSSLQKIKIPDSVIVIGERAFDACIKLQHVDIGKGVKTIKEFAFRCCSELEILSLPNNIETIEAMAFSYTGLKELIIPLFCSKITGNPIAYNNVRIKSNSPHFIVENDILFTSNMNELISFQSSLSTFIIPNSVTRIGSYAFWYSSNLKNIVIPPSVKDIGTNPFAYCNLVIDNQSKEFLLKKGLLTDIKRSAIIGYYSDNKTIYIPEGIKSIERSAFCDSKISEVKLPYSIMSIKDYAFAYSTIEEIKIPNSVKFIGNRVFSNCTYLRWVNLPQYIKYYGESIFYGCTSLQTIDIPDGIKHIKKYMFSYCRTLENISIANSVTRIFNYAFYACESLNELIIPSSVQYIGKSAFQFCRNLKAIYIPNTVNYIGFKAFNDCQLVTVHKTGRRIWREYDSLNLIATTPGNKDKLIKMLPKFLHNIIEEMTYKEFINRDKSLYSNVNTEEEYNNVSLECVKCPRCGNWYFEGNGVCDICGYPWNE